MSKSFGKFGGLGNPHCNKNSNIGKPTQYENRIKQAKKLENKFFEKIKEELGFVIKNSTSFEDKHLGIDGYLISLNNNKTLLKQEIPIQLKIRNKSDKIEQKDVLIEVIKPWFPTCDFEGLAEKAFTGKDFKSKAELMLSLSPDGKSLRMRKMKEILENSKFLTNQFLENFKKNRKLSLVNEYGEARIIQEKFNQCNANLSGNIKKLVTFLNPDNFIWKKDIMFKTSL